MHTYQAVFKRYEKKYILTNEKYEILMAELNGKITPDVYGAYHIRNIYFDTEDREMIRTSIEKPVYKEKLRLRCYGQPEPSDKVFVELKKKYAGVVYKRRISMPLTWAENYLYKDEIPPADSQILHEIEWVRQRYHLMPSAAISYDRKAYFMMEDSRLRMTFDTNILAREDTLRLSADNFGLPVLEEGCILMEVKIPDAMPVWLSRLFAQLRIFPVSFSKYGTYYKLIKGGSCCA